ncbi:MAG: flagellar assembly protein FliW [Acidobacteria bacterium]|nr:flagellar assembly protein FliW [Acidobacteriota bacterium]
MFKVKTTRFGEIDVPENEVIHLPLGLIGFPELKKYVLLDHDKESPFKWFQSLEDGAIAFVLIDPLLFKPDYVAEVTDNELTELDVQTEEDLVISVIVTVPSNPQNMTANLKAPLIFNLKNRRGKQVILNTSQFNTRHNIMDEVRERVGAGEAATVKEAVEKAKIEKEKESQTKSKVVNESKTWSATRIIEHRPGGRLDYPSMIQSATGAIHLTYSYELKTIKHVELNEEWVRQQP